MKNFLLAFVLFLLWSAFGIWIYSCKVKGLCDPPPPPPPPVAIETDSTATDEKYGSEFALEQFNDFVITSGTDTVLVAETSSNVDQLLFDYLNTNQEKELLITGLYADGEDSTQGQARALHLKGRFVTFGINPDRIATQSVHDSFRFNEDGRYNGGVRLQYRDLMDDRKELIEKGISHKTLYASFGSEKFQPDNTLTAYAGELRSYLDKYPAKQVVITGHTDNIGPVEANEWMGMQRAKNVLKYLVSTGIPEDKLEARSEGPHRPIASNATQEGRKQNRRIEINVN